MDIKRIEEIAAEVSAGGLSFTQDGNSLLQILQLADVDFSGLPAPERVGYLTSLLKLLDRKFRWETAKRLGETPATADLREAAVYKMLATLYVLQHSGILVK